MSKSGLIGPWPHDNWKYQHVHYKHTSSQIRTHQEYWRKHYVLLYFSRCFIHFSSFSLCGPISDLSNQKNIEVLFLQLMSNSELHIIVWLLMGLVKNFIHFTSALHDSCVRDSTHSFPGLLLSTKHNKILSLIGITSKRLWTVEETRRTCKLHTEKGIWTLLLSCLSYTTSTLVCCCCSLWPVTSDSHVLI